MELENRKILGKRIRQLRLERGLTQGQLAVMIGDNSKQYIFSIEKGDKNVTLDVLSRIAAALSVKVKDLIEF